MTAPVVWPRTIPPLNASYDLLPRPVMGPPSISGGFQSVQSDAGFWVIEFQEIPLGGARLRAFRALSALLNGPATPVLVPVFERDRAPWPLADGKPVMEMPTTHSDGTPFSDGFAYAQSVIDATSAVAALGATALTITFNTGGTLEGGMLFSIKENLYLTKTVFLNSAGPPSVYSCTFLPPLRAAVTAGTVLNFDTPVCRCTLAGPGGLPLTIQYGSHARPSVSFTEDFP